MCNTLDFRCLWAVFASPLLPKYLTSLYHLGASHSKSFEFILVPLIQCGGTNFKAFTVFLFPKIGHLPFLFTALFYGLICISLSEFRSGFSWYKTLRTSSCILWTAHLCNRKCLQHFRSRFEDDLSLMGGFLRQLLVS